MHEEIIIAGFGGQGVLFAGQLLAKAAVAEGRHVTWIPSYGPEMRGGTANCTVVISDEPIGSPLTHHPTVVISLNEPALERFAPMVRPGGYLLLDSSLITRRSGRTDIHEIALPAKEMADRLGYPQSANVVLLGALIGATGVVQLRSVEEALAEMLGARKADALAANKHALHMGAVLETDVAPALAIVG